MARVAAEKLTFVGDLWAVTVARPGGGERFVEVSPSVLGVGRGVGLVTADSRGELARGIVHREPKREPALVLVKVWYYRDRRQGEWWYHDTPQGFCAFDGESGDGLPFVWLDSRASVACGVEDFICN